MRGIIVLITNDLTLDPLKATGMRMPRKVISLDEHSQKGREGSSTAEEVVWLQPDPHDLAHESHHRVRPSRRKRTGGVCPVSVLLLTSRSPWSL